MRRLNSRRILLGILGLGVLANPALRAQAPVGGPPIVQNDPQPISADPNVTEPDPESRLLALRRARALNEMRQKQVVSDTDKLLKLAQELSDGSAAGETRLTVEQRLKKLAQMEKLAKRVREQMSYAVAGGPSMATPFSVPLR